MLSTKKMLAIFLPALIIVGLAFFIQIVNYKPLFPKLKETTSEFTIPLSTQDPIIGNSKAANTIIAFEDFACESCKQHNEYLENLQKKYPNKCKIIWKGLPVAVYPYPSLEAQKYGYCAEAQKKFSEFKDYAFANTDNLSDTTLQTIAEEIKLDQKKLDKCLSDEETTVYIENTKQIAQILSIQSVPAFFINNKQISNPNSEYGWEEILGLNQ